MNPLVKCVCANFNSNDFTTLFILQMVGKGDLFVFFVMKGSIRDKMAEDVIRNRLNWDKNRTALAI